MIFLGAMTNYRTSTFVRLVGCWSYGIPRTSDAQQSDTWFWSHQSKQISSFAVCVTHQLADAVCTDLLRVFAGTSENFWPRVWLRGQLAALSCKTVWTGIFTLPSWLCLCLASAPVCRTTTRYCDLSGTSSTIWGSYHRLPRSAEEWIRQTGDCWSMPSWSSRTVLYPLNSAKTNRSVLRIWATLVGNYSSRSGRVIGGPVPLSELFMFSYLFVKWNRGSKDPTSVRFCCSNDLPLYHLRYTDPV